MLVDVTSYLNSFDSFFARLQPREDRPEIGLPHRLKLQRIKERQRLIEEHFSTEVSLHIAKEQDIGWIVHISAHVHSQAVSQAKSVPQAYEFSIGF
jgi:hypothetical protein